MTAIQIQRRLMLDRFRRSFVLPNYTPKDWWECDVFEITDAGYFVEYEIKLSVKDFEVDALKSKTEVWNGGESFSPPRNKHAELALGLACGPSRFYFVTPEDLKIEIPRWAGHIKIRNGNHEIPLVENVVRAPTLHRQKFAPNLRAAAESTCYWRMHSLFIWRKIGDIETQVQE